MDAEGSEYFILQGGQNFIQRHPKMKIMMEWNPKFFKNNGSHIEEFIDWIKNHHFKVYDILNNGDLKLIKVEDLFKKDFSDLLLVPAE